MLYLCICELTMLSYCAKINQTGDYFMMKYAENLLKFGIDFLAAILLASIVAILTPLIVEQGANLNYVFVYIWFASLILVFLLSWKIYQSHKNRFFLPRFKNEEEALPTLTKLIDESNRKLCILSKVGTSIFFNFNDYAFALKKGRIVQVLMADPDDTQLIELMDRIYIQQTNVSKSWISMLSKLRAKLDDINEKIQLPEKGYSLVRNLLDKNKDGKNGYRSLIYASIMMWEMAQQIANRNLSESGSTLTTHGLDIRTSSVLPDIKANYTFF